MLDGRDAFVEPSSGRQQAERFIEALTGSTESVVTFQTYPDPKGVDTVPPAVIHATLADAWDRLMDLQEHAHGVFVMVAEGDGLGRSAEHVIGLRALFADDDYGTVNFSRLGRAPNIVVRSGHGHHYYWCLQPGEPPALFTAAQKAIATKLGTDPAVSDLARVLRLPGTLNYKDMAKPAPVELVSAQRATGALTDILLDLGITQAATVPVAPAAKAKAVVTPGSQRLVATRDIERARAYIATIRAVEGQGGNLATFKAAASLLRDFAIPGPQAWDLLWEWNFSGACDPPWSEKELNKIFVHAARHGKGPIGAKYADAAAGLTPDADGKTVVDHAAESDPTYDPANWCADVSGGAVRWRQWQDGEWLDGITESAMDRLLTNGAGLNKRAADAWKKKVPAVRSCEPVYDSSERLVQRQGRLVANTFRRPTLAACRGDYAPIQAVLRNLAGGDERVFLWLEGWLAKVVQNVYAGKPARIGVAPVLTGPKGAGKGTLEEVCKAILGPSNVASITQETLESRFNGYLDGTLLVFANEVFTSDARAGSQAAKLKELITAHRHPIERKGRDLVYRPAVENWILASNSHRPVVVERGDRRFSIIRTGGPIGPELGALVADDARANGPMVRAYLGHLLALPADRLVADYRPLETSAKADALLASAPSASRYAEEIAARGFYSTTPPDTAPRDLYLAGPEGLRAIEEGHPLLARRRLMDLYRQYCAEINAPAQQESTLMAALREVFGDALEFEVLVNGRREPVVTGLPGMLPPELPVSLAPPEAPLPLQRTLAV